MGRVVGVDLSLTATGIGCDCGSAVIKSKYRGPERLHDISRGVLAHATGVCKEPGIHPAVVVLENYSFNSKFKGEFMGELGGVVRTDLWRNNIVYVDVPPAMLKRFGTGKGNVGKDEVLAAAIRRFHFEGVSNNEADAWILWNMGVAHYHIVEHPEDPDIITDYQREALAKIEWPEL